MRNRVEEIKSKGFNIVNGSFVEPEIQQPINYAPIDYAKLRVGLKTLDDAVLTFGDMRKSNPRLASKEQVLKAINDYDLDKMREISDFFYRTSGIYSGVLRYLAFMYRYDWYVTPYIKDKSMKKEKIIETFTQCLDTLDNFHVKKKFGEIALKVLRHGVYYGYKIEQNGSIVIQELAPNYCRSRLGYGDKPAVEFNMKFFDDYFKDIEQRMKMLKIFPQEFQKGYQLYKQGKLKPDFAGDDKGWYLLDPELTIRFTLNGEEYPPFISIVPLILDLDAAQELDRKKTMQRLLKIVVQKMPLDKNGDLIFDVDEAQQLHNNAVQMLGRAIGVDVLTTFADVEVETLASDNTSTQTDDLERVERQLYNDATVSKLLFNSDGNIALTNSILTDNSTMFNLISQFEIFLNEVLKKYNTNKKKVEYKVQILTTTWYNYQELAKLYKEQVTLGYSKMLPQIALGQSQSSVLSNAFFENDILNLSDVFIPPMQSSTMNADSVSAIKARKNGGDASASDNKGGRPEKPDTEKTEKTIQNIESKS